MKKALSFLLLSIATLFFFSCSNLFDNTGSVTIKLPGASSARFVNNNYEASDIEYYTVTVSGIGFSESRNENPGASISFNELAPGKYTVEVKAFTHKYSRGTTIEESSHPLLAAFGNITTEVVAGETTRAIIPISTIYPATISRTDSQISNISVQYKKAYEITKKFLDKELLSNCSAYVTYQDGKSVLFENLETLNNFLYTGAIFNDGNNLPIGNLRFPINWRDYTKNLQPQGIIENPDLSIPDLVVPFKYIPTFTNDLSLNIDGQRNDFPAYGQAKLILFGYPCGNSFNLYDPSFPNDYEIFSEEYDLKFSFSKPGLTAEINESSEFIISSSTNEEIETTFYVDIVPKSNQYTASFDKNSLTNHLSFDLKVNPYTIQIIDNKRLPVDASETLEIDNFYDVIIANESLDSIQDWDVSWTITPNDAAVELTQEQFPSQQILKIRADSLSNTPSSVTINCEIINGSKTFTISKIVNLPALPPTFRSLVSATLKQTSLNMNYVLPLGATSTTSSSSSSSSSSSHTSSSSNPSYFVLASNSGGKSLSTSDFRIIGKYSDNTEKEISDSVILGMIKVSYPEDFAASNISKNMPITLSYNNKESVIQSNICAKAKPQKPTISINSENPNEFKFSIAPNDSTFDTYDSGTKGSVSPNKVFFTLSISNLDGTETFASITQNEIPDFDPANISINLNELSDSFTPGTTYTIKISAYSTDETNSYFYNDESSTEIITKQMTF